MTAVGLDWLRVRAIARRHAFVLRRSPHRLFDVTIWPLVDTLLFGSLAVFVSRRGGNGSVAFGYLLSGIVLWHVVYQSQIAVSTGFLEETWSRSVISILASPLVLDLVLFLDLAQRAGMKGIQEWLSFYFKSPQHAPTVYPEHDLFIQQTKLKNTLRWLMGEEQITHLGAEYYQAE